MTIERIEITDRLQWLELRRRDITASDVAAVCGEGMYGSAAKVWAEKRGLIPPVEMNEAMKRGLWGEAAVFEAIAWEYPEWEIRRAKIYLRDNDVRLGATPDGLAIVPDRKGIGVVQCKVIARPIFEAEWLDDPDGGVDGPASVPLGYQLQTLTEAMLAEAAWAAVAVLVVDTFRWKLRIFFLDRHVGAEQMIRDRVGAFWTNYLDTGVQPLIDPSRDADLVKALYPRDDETEIDLTGDNLAPVLVDELTTVKATIKQAEARESEIKTDLQSKLGSHTYGRLRDGRRLSWKLQRRGSYVVKETEFRVLRVLKA